MPSSSSSSPSSSSSSSCKIALLILLFLITHTASSTCPPETFTCGQTTLEIKFPFFTNKTSLCPGLHYIQCMDFVPTVHFQGIDYLYPVTYISYLDHTIVINDLKLSSYFTASDCVFLYDFRKPILNFDFNFFSVSLSSGESFFDCLTDYDFSRDIFLRDYNLSLCRDYSVYYSGHYEHENSAYLPGYCSNSSQVWFQWKLLFGGGEDGGETSLLGAGFSPLWAQHEDCFSCEIADGRDCSNSCQGRQKKARGVIIVVSVAGSILLITIICFTALIFQRRSQQKQQPSSSSTISPFAPKDFDLASYPQETQIFSYDELIEATNSFNAASEIGDGGSGAVYKGKLRDGRTVAVKRLYETNFKRAEQFVNEIKILSRLRHINLVSLYGCTSPVGRDLLLVYEFVPNGTVDDHLHGPRAGESLLTWPLRLSVAVETAAALAYLHAVDPPIVHRDVKTRNILLDAELHVKVADFGLSRLFPPDGSTHISTAPMGTPGYLDPEYHQSYQLSDRSDVYSFGVVLAELISSKPAVDLNRDRTEINLSAMVVNRIQNGKLDELVDRRLGFDDDPEMRRVFKVLAEICAQCLQADRLMRPGMKEVLDVLTELQMGVSVGFEKGGG